MLQEVFRENLVPQSEGTTLSPNVTQERMFPIPPLLSLCIFTAVQASLSDLIHCYSSSGRQIRGSDIMKQNSDSVQMAVGCPEF